MVRAPRRSLSTETTCLNEPQRSERFCGVEIFLAYYADTEVLGRIVRIIIHDVAIFTIANILILNAL